jgi:hypothetical protein
MCKALTGLTVTEFNNLLVDFPGITQNMRQKRKQNEKERLAVERKEY